MKINCRRCAACGSRTFHQFDYVELRTPVVVGRSAAHIEGATTWEHTRIANVRCANCAAVLDAPVETAELGQWFSTSR